MPEADKTIELAGVAQVCPCHACAFFSSKEAENAVLVPFMAEGIAAGDKCVNIIDADAREERLQALASAGIDVVSAERSGQLELRPWEKAHLIGGRFDQRRMLADLERDAAAGLQEQRKTRLWSNQEWVLKGLPGTDKLAEYECRFNAIWPKYNDITVCVYDATKFSADVLVDMLRTHPTALVGGVLRDNPFYVEPDELLHELTDRRRRSARPKARSLGRHLKINEQDMNANGSAALGIVESLLIALTEMGIISDKDARGLLEDVVAAHLEAARSAQAPERHLAVSEIIRRILAGRNGVRT